MKLRRHLAIPLLITTLGSLAATGGVAHADTYRHRDATHDVRLIKSSATKDFAAPARRIEDVRSVRITHSHRSVRVVQRTRGVPAGHVTVMAFIKTPKTHFILMASRDYKQFGLPNRVTLLDPRSHKVPCAGARFAVHRHRHATVLMVPRACLGSPRWVRLGAVTGTIEDHGSKWYVDDALSQRIADAGPRQTGRIHAG